jgi:hypothetical protein
VVLGNRTNLAEAQAKGNATNAAKAAAFAAKMAPEVLRLKDQARPSTRSQPN